MAIQYEWKLTGLRKQDQGGYEGVIVGTNWKCIGTDDDGNKGEFNGATPFKAEEIDPENFTTYADLTESQVLGWIKEYVSGSNKATNYWDHISERIGKQIFESANPITSVLDNQFPWVSGSADNNPSIPV